MEATQDDYVPQALNKEEQTGLHFSGHSGKLLIASDRFIDIRMIKTHIIYFYVTYCAFIY